MEEIINLIANTSFPIGITVFLLVRFEKKLDNLTKSISDLTIAVQTLLKG